MELTKTLRKTMTMPNPKGAEQMMGAIQCMLFGAAVHAKAISPILGENMDSVRVPVPYVALRSKNT